jgi:hypothetical protein
VLVFIECKSRIVHLAGVTANPTGEWVTQQARNVIGILTERASPTRFLIHDRDTKFTASFDEVFRSEGMRIIRTPVRAPRANAFMERWFGTLRRECLDRLLILGRRHLEAVLREYVSHYNEHRPLARPTAADQLNRDPRADDLGSTRHPPTGRARWPDPRVRGGCVMRGSSFRHHRRKSSRGASGGRASSAALAIASSTSII